MLIVCSGPESFKARQKYRELTEAFRVKHDPRSSSMESITSKDALAEVVSKLSSPTLFTSMKLLRCEYLFADATPAKIKKFNLALERDANQTVVLDYEDKPLTAKNASAITSTLSHFYSFEKLIGAELKQEISRMCSAHNVSSEVAPKLIEIFNDDLWAVDTMLQMLSVADSAADVKDLSSSATLESVYSLVDSILDGNGSWLFNAAQTDPNELLATLISQARQWLQLQANETDGVHPYVQKKLSYKKFKDADTRTLSFIRVLAASRSSLAIQQEAVQLIR